jgi:hypothetical protein
MTFVYSTWRVMHCIEGIQQAVFKTIDFESRLSVHMLRKLESAISLTLVCHFWCILPGGVVWMSVAVTAGEVIVLVVLAEGRTLC